MTAEYDITYIDIRLAAGQPNAPAYDRCRWCTHEWHGFRCYSCDCSTSIGARDDSWRPRFPLTRQFRLLELMHDTGVDGYTADAVVGNSGVDCLSAVRNSRLQACLHGRP